MLGGGFFRYYLHSALSGSAVGNGDGIVTLSETYSEVYRITRFATRSLPNVQTPSFDFDLTGAGDIRLIQLDRDDATLSFPASLTGVFQVCDDEAERYVAEIDTRAQRSISLYPGTYTIQ